MKQKKIPLKTTIHFEQLQNSTKRISVFQGGTRSAKTYNILIWIIIYLCQTQGKVVTICRETLPSLRGTAMRDFFEILESIGLYDVKSHNKTNNEYTLNKNLVEFISIDESQKIRGRKRNILFINEANEINKEAWLQLAFRTTDKIILDYNPSDENHFIYEDVIPRDDCDFYISTYLDNPFLHKSLVDEIERLKNTDENYWNIYGLGQRGKSLEKIYTHWQTAKQMPDSFDEIIYGLDFGFNNPCALVEYAIKDRRVYLTELLHQSGLTNTDLIGKLNLLIANKNNYLYADCAEPARIEEIQRCGYNIFPADKSVKDGIDYIKSLEIYINPNSTKMIKEFQSYSWKKTKDGIILDEPIKFNDHCFVGTTKIKTSTGDKNISEIKVGEQVYTPIGFKTVEEVFKFENKDVYDYGIGLTCTNNHKIYTQNKGYTPIHNLIKQDTLFIFDELNFLKCQYTELQKLLSTTKLNSDAIQTLQNQITGIITNAIATILNKVLDICTGTFGNSTTKKKFQRATISTIKTVILKTIQLKILNLNLRKNIFQNTQRNGKKEIPNLLKRIWIRLDHSLRYGIVPQRVENGIDSTQSVEKQSDTLRTVWFVENQLKQQSDKFSVIKIAKQSIEENYKGKADVYDIKVEDEHCYFANNILVHNSPDATRYAGYTHSKQSLTNIFIM